MLITHLGLTVRDPERSKHFYLEQIKLTGTTTTREWGYSIDLTDGFMLALIRGEPTSEVSSDVHFGCALPDPATVRSLRRDLQDADVAEIVWEDTSEYVGIKVLDPD